MSYFSQTSRLGLLCGLNTGVIVAALTLGTALAEGWNGRNNPGNILGSQYTTILESLPASASLPVDRIPYSDTYWPQNRGGIAYRWNSSEPYLLTGERFDDQNRLHRDGAPRWVTGWTNPHLIVDPSVLNYHKYTLNELLDLARNHPQRIRELSPAEKFDILRGRCIGCRNTGFWSSAYPLTNEVLSRSSNYKPYWAGSCHGWAPASAHHAEPQPVEVMSPDGILIPFGSGDVKALLNFYYGNRNRRASYVGGICRTDLVANPGAAEIPDCRDVNAGAFHIALGNTVGLRQQSLLADTERGMEVWNYPIYEYRSRFDVAPDFAANQVLANSQRGSGTVRSVYVETSITYADDNEDFGPDWWPLVGTACFRKDSSQYKYWLDLDSMGRIVGGSWVSAERPDNLWSKSRYEFGGDFAELSYVYREMNAELRERFVREQGDFYRRCEAASSPISTETPSIVR